ncbi:MAG: hypothetical protein GC164_10750 [Phycisphaera sp.]|nr:hypothetical protein [Phycisphaera sp.]
MNAAAQSPPRPNSTRLVIVALVLAALAVVAVNLYIANIKKQLEEASFTVYRLNRSLQPGEKFRAVYAVPTRMPLSYKESFEGFVQDKEGSLSLSNFDGDTVYASVGEGDFLRDRIFREATGDEALRPGVGMRFVKLNINPRNAPGSLMQGEVVDVLAPFASPGRVPEVMVVMENVKVVAVGSRVAQIDTGDSRTKPVTNYHNITIEVEPQEAVDLAMIEELSTGDFQIVIRNQADLGHPFTGKGGINDKVLELLAKARSGS